jgi:AcrR family transcriptional regulator
VAQISDMAQRRAMAREAGDSEYRRRRAELVEAAASVFKRKGFRAANLNDIAGEVGMDRASLYYYASGKDELFREVVLVAVRENVAMAERVRDGAGGADAKIGDFIGRLMLSYERHYPYLFVYVQENMAHIDREGAWGQDMIVLGKRFDSAVRDIVQQGLDEGSLRAGEGDARLIANAIIGMCNWSHRWFHPTGRNDAKAIGGIFSELVLRGLAVTNS